MHDDVYAAPVIDEQNNGVAQCGFSRPVTVTTPERRSTRAAGPPKSLLRITYGGPAGSD
jgi:hypothetical protein